MDDNRDKEMMRNQVIAIVLMTVVVFVWINWFMPKPQKRPAPQQQTAQTEEAAQRPETTPEGAPRQPEETVAPEADGETPGLPEIPAITDPAEEEVTLSNDQLELVFTRIGARLKRASLILGDDGDDSVQLVPEPSLPMVDTEMVYPLGLRFSDEALGDQLDYRRFDVEPDAAGRSVTFSLTLPNKATIRKHFMLTDQPNVVDVQVDYENLEEADCVVGMDQTPAYVLNWGPNVFTGEQATRFTKREFVWRKSGLIDVFNVDKMKPSATGEFRMDVANPEWFAYKSTYFVVALKPDFESSKGYSTGSPGRFRFGLAVPRFDVPSQAAHSSQFSLYMGPSQQEALAGAWDTLPEVLRFFKNRPMDWFAKLLLRIMNWFHANIIANYGLAIIFLTIVVRVAMYPLTLKSMKSMKKMQLLGPEMEEMKAKHGDNPQELNKKMMELYKERGVNPLGGCLPIALQMPIFITLYRMLWQAYELRGAPFVLWVTDLSQPDRLLHMPWMTQVPFIGSGLEYLNVLPILMGISMILHQKLMPTPGAGQNQQQKMMMTFMPVFFCFICYNMASGLNLYILTSTVLGMVQQKFTRVSESELQTKKKRTVGKRQHFYTAAKARQRQLAKESKQSKKRKPKQSSGGSKN